MIKNNILITTLIILNFFSCKEETKEHFGNNQINIKNNKIKFFNFPDTVKLQKMVDGVLNYNMEIEKLDQKNIKEKYTFLHLLVNNNSKEISLEKMNKSQNKFVFEDSLMNGEITFKVPFSQLGRNNLHFVIEELIVLKDSSLQINDKVKLLTRETNFEKDVLVVD